MGIDLLKDIYNPLAKRDEPQDMVSNPSLGDTTSCGHDSNHQPLNSWQDSAPIMRLSAYMKETKEHGITIISRCHIPALHFNPGLCRKDPDDRWQIAYNIERLFWEAFEDLKGLIKIGRLELPELSDHVDRV